MFDYNLIRIECNLCRDISNVTFFYYITWNKAKELF